MPDLTKITDDSFGKLTYRVSGPAYRCKLRALDFTYTDNPEPDVVYTVERLSQFAHKNTAYHTGKQLYHGPSLTKAWRMVEENTGKSEIPDRLASFPEND